MGNREQLSRGIKVTLRRGLFGLSPVAESLLAAAVGLILGAIIMAISGFSPLLAYAALLKGGFSSTYALATSAARATPLLLTGLTFAICVRAGMFNIGAEGQLYMGALAAVTLSFLVLPPGLAQIVGILFGMTAGALWSLIPALLRAFRGVNEVISTIMFNWLSHFFAFYLVAKVLVDPRRSSQTVRVPVEARFPILIRGTDLSYAIFVSLAFALLVYFLLWHTATGYEIRAAGLNPRAAKYGGIKPKRTMIMSFLLGGMAAGLAGAMMAMGTPPSYAVLGGLSQIANLGFDGMAVAMVGRTHPLGMIVSAFFFGGLAAGAREMQMTAGVPAEMVRIVQGVIVIAMAVPELSRMFRVFRRRWPRLFRGRTEI